MSIELDELLTLVGRLDDAPGFDTPRERFRRFLIDHVADLQLAQALIESCQRSVGEQRHRALQDLVVLLGRFLQFEPRFGAYGPDTDSAGVDGYWQSRGGVDVVLEIRTDQTADLTLESLAKAVSMAAVEWRVHPRTRVGLCVMARHYAARGRLERAIAIEKPPPGLSIVSVHSLLALAAHVIAGRLTHADVVKLLNAGVALDIVIELLDRPTAAPASTSPLSERIGATPRLLADEYRPAFWVATISGNGEAAPEQLVTSVIGGRRVLGPCVVDPHQADAACGDWVCFFIRDKGMVGHAQLASVLDNGASVVRDGGQCCRVFQLKNVAIYRDPLVQALRAGRPFAVPSSDVALPGTCLTPIERQDFIALTRDQPGALAP